MYVNNNRETKSAIEMEYLSKKIEMLRISTRILVR